MTAYYNENDPKAAAWLRELIGRGLIAPGEVDERSIEDIKHDEIRHFTQCHFFAGIGVWSYSLRRAGWPDTRPVWTGSCPCQPFSSAGKRGGEADKRHLWPAWEYLIAQCRPEVVFGEQVASKDGLAWFDLVQTDLEGSGYAVGANDLCAAGVGAPHIRQRLYFVAERLADAGRAEPSKRELEQADFDRSSQTRQQPGNVAASYGADGGMADSEHDQQRQGRGSGSEDSARDEPGPESGGCSVAGGLGDTRCESGERDAGSIPAAQTELPGSWDSDGRHGIGHPDAGETGGLADTLHRRQQNGATVHRESKRVVRQPETRCKSTDNSSADFQQPNPTNGLWRAADWLGCRDGKFRPVEPGTFPLVDGAPARVGRLRGYGNAINAEVARIFIEAYLEVE